MWLWLAVRNPANYFGRFVLGIDAKDYRYKLPRWCAGGFRNQARVAIHFGHP